MSTFLNYCEKYTMENEDKIQYDLANTSLEDDIFLDTLNNYLPIRKEQLLYDILKRLDDKIQGKNNI